jgi:hypothetical protein
VTVLISSRHPRVAFFIKHSSTDTQGQTSPKAVCSKLYTAHNTTNPFAAKMQQTGTFPKVRPSERAQYWRERMNDKEDGSILHSQEAIDIGWATELRKYK